MILAALNSLYERTVGTEGGPPPLGYAEVPVVGAVNIDAGGEVRGLSDLRREETVDRHTRRVPARLVVPQPPPNRRGLRIEPGFLCDNAGYLLGYARDGNMARAAAQFAAERKFHEILLSGIAGADASALLAFFRGWDASKAAALIQNHPEMATGTLALRDAETGVFFHDMSGVRAAWKRHSAHTDSPRGQCLITGHDDEPLALIHPQIKGVQGAQSSGAALVSFNCDAFTSYGKQQNLNAPVGVAAAFAYTTALNHLLRPHSRRKLRLGDAAVVVWAERATPAEPVIASVLGAIADEEGDDAEENRVAPVHDQLRRIAAGLWASDPEFERDAGIRFFVLGLAPNAARLQLRFFYTSTLGELLKHLQQHCRDILLQPPEVGVRVPTLWHLARETLPKDREGRPRSEANTQEKLDGDLTRAVLTGLDYPQLLLPIVLGRFRNDGRLTPERLGLVKGCINRYRRIYGGIKPEVTMALDETSSEPGYLLGRLFAQLENIQQLSRGNAGRDQPTIRDRFMGAASVTPLSVFPYLLNLENAHEREAKRDRPRIAHAAARDLARLVERVRDFPSQLSPHQQGLFFIGYHHQRQARFAGRADESDDNKIYPNAEN
jgi:CRISPR-associated protein Csd1